MSDVKSVIALLCKHFQLSIGSSIKPEHFRLAKYNKDDAEATQAFWKILHILSRHVVKDMQIDDDLERYDDIYATKLYFAFMQYQRIEFYALSPGDNSVSRELLLSLGWLFATKKALNIAIEAKLATNFFGREFSCVDDSWKAKVDEDRSPSKPNLQMNVIVNKCGKIGHNIKEIAELIQEKIKLTTKIHAASLNTSALPHLSVNEITLAKKMFGKKTADYTRKEEESIEELNSMAMILDSYMQWTKKEHIFFDWMVKIEITLFKDVLEVTVIEEGKKSEDKSCAASEHDELSGFVSLLRHVTKKKVHSMKNRETESSDPLCYSEPCVSRFLRTQQEGESEIEKWIRKTSERLSSVEIDVEEKIQRLSVELRKMLKYLPNCIEI